MANLSEDIQCSGFDTRPPMLDRTDFASWQQRIRLYCQGKENGVNILKSIDEGPYKMGTFRETLAESTEGTPQFSPERPRLYSDLTSKEKDRYNADIRAINILLQGLPKTSIPSSIITSMLKTFGQCQDAPRRICDGCEAEQRTERFHYDQLYASLKQHETHAKENKMILERFSQPTVDPLALLSNVSNPQHYSPSSSASSSIQVPSPLAESSSPAEDLIKNLTNTLALLTQSYRTFLPQTNNQLRTSSNAKNQAIVQDGRVVVQNVQRHPNRGGQDNVFDDDVDEQPVQDLALNVDNVFQADDYPVTDEAGPSYDSNILSEVPGYEHYMDAACAHHKGHYVRENKVPVVHSGASSIPTDAFMMIYNDMCKSHDPSISNTSRNTVVKNSLTAELATYKEHVELYEQRAKFELTEREQKINDQLRIVIFDRNFKEETLKRQLHSIKLQLASTINHSKSIVEEVSFLKMDFKQKENKYLADFLDMKTLKEKGSNWLQEPFMPHPCQQLQPALYNGHENIKDNHTPAIVHKSEDTLEIAEITRKKINDKMNDPKCVTRKTKACYLQKVISLFKTLKDNFEGIPKALTKEVKEMKDVFEELEAEVAQYVIDRKRDAIELKNILIANDNLIAECLSQGVFCVATNFKLNVARFTKVYVANTTAEARCLALEAELANLRDTNNHDNQKELIKNFSKLEGKDNVIRQLKKQRSQFQVTRSDTDCTLRAQTTDSQITKLTDHVTHLQEQNDLFRAKNDKIKQHYKELYNSIKITHAKHIEQVTKLTTKNVNLKTSVSKATVNPQVSARDKHAIDVELIVPCLRNNMDAHLDYLRHLKESVETIYDIIKEAKVPKSNPKPNKISPAKGVNKLAVKDQPKAKMSYVRTTNRVDFSSRLKRIVINLNSDSICQTCNKFLTSFDHDMCVATYLISAVTPPVIRHNYNVVQKRPTGQILNLGKQCPLTRQFCNSDLEVAFRKHSCYVRDTDGVELIKGSHGSNLYTISIEDMMKSFPICLLSKASKNKSWLWHRRLNHLNFDTINDLARKDLVRGLPRLKFEKDHFCSACQLGKSKKHTHKPKAENTNLEVLNTFHMDLYGPMRVQTINGKKYILVIVDDYSRFTWVKILRSKDETPDVVIKFITQIQVGLNKTVQYVRTDSGTEFVNHTMTEYYERLAPNLLTPGQISSGLVPNVVPATPSAPPPSIKNWRFYFNQCSMNIWNLLMLKDRFLLLKQNQLQSTQPIHLYLTPLIKMHPLQVFHRHHQRYNLTVYIKALQLNLIPWKNAPMLSLAILHFFVLSKVKPKNFKSAITEDCGFQAMQDEIHEFDRLQVWELVPQPDYVMIIALKWIYKVKLDEYGDVLKNKAHHAGCHDTRRSTSKSAQFLGDKLGTKREVSGMPIPCSLITADIREASHNQEYLANVTKHRRFLAGETRSAQDLPAPKPAKPARKPKPTAQKDQINIL
uniref:Integrase, catalytic region, zinc finger, CCHC-type, peptidase aspartic, catalytic n=1 Tax=Tanacetum cinerariifolium TaxID=118510 RepID=A0A6L2J9J8_TANCI|nr:integrase, catalytic region, zinc finger, CCHC-type, peptidase aspartic, catalytic [Tanacetum cinerariifolium]